MANGPHLTQTGYEVPWRERLSTRLLAFLAGAVLVAVAALSLAEAGVERELRAQLQAESELVSGTVRGALHRAMLQDRRDEAYRIMDDVARQPGLSRLRLFDAAGRVTYATAPREAGAGGPAEGRDDRILARSSPIPNDVSCATAACHAHPAQQSTLGTLEVSISLARLDATTAAFRLRSLAVSAAVAALLGLAFWLFARRHVVQPVGALVAAAHRVARQDLEAEVPDTFDGELGLLGAAFNEMTGALRASRREVQALLTGLETKVAERSDALAAARGELVRTERLGAIGKLSASLAHQINDPISGIMTFARLMGRTLEAGTPDEATRRTLLRNLRLVEKESQRCSDLLRDLLDFAHLRPPITDELSPNAVVEDALRLVSSQLTIQGTKLEKRLGDLPRTLGDAGQLRQACVNVLMNALEAMPFGGTLTIETAVLDDGRAVELAFADTGPGIPPEQQGRVFDPFFTTKADGVGLGLSVVHGILARHGGAVSLRSEPGHGTRVALRLPVTRREGAAAAA
jgi:two-component system, NtrC family, sensor kinase